MRRLLNKLNRIIAVLLIAVMVVFPVLDALACAFESPTDHAIEAVVGDDAAAQGDQDDTQRMHAECVHNHCHHGAANVPMGPELGPDVRAKGGMQIHEDDTRLSVVHDGLMRPPRT